MSTRPRYGVDGWPYLVGLSISAVALPGVAALVRRRSPAAAVVLAGLGAAAAVPAGLGLRYVAVGKTGLRDRLLDAVPWRGDEVVVDLGCGTGLLALGAALRTRGPVHGVDLWRGGDLSGNGPARLHRNAGLLGVADRLVVHTGDVRSLRLPDRSVDVVLSALCLHNLPDAAARAAALAEAVRVLRPGGTLALADLAHVEQEYAPYLRAEGFAVRTERAPATFPPQRVLVARSAR